MLAAISERKAIGRAKTTPGRSRSESAVTATEPPTSAASTTL